MIEVEITEYAANRHGHDTLLGMALMKALKEAGIPALGDSFVMRGIERGSMTYTSSIDLDGLLHHFTWREDADDRKEGTPLRVKLSGGGFARKWGRHAVVPEDDEL